MRQPLGQAAADQRLFAVGHEDAGGVVDEALELAEFPFGERDDGHDLPSPRQAWPAADSRASAAISSLASTCSISSSTTNLPLHLPMPAMKSGRMRVPNDGAGSMSAALMSTTALTASTSMPSTCLACRVVSASPSPSPTSTMTMQERLPMVLTPRPKRADRSSTGTTAPRRLMTPRTQSGIIGTVARLPYSMISLMCRMPTANCSWPSIKVRNWVGLGAAACSTTARWDWLMTWFMLSSRRPPHAGHAAPRSVDRLPTH